MRRAGAEFQELTGLRAEAVTRFERVDGGWAVEAEVTELARVPDTMSLMATYEVTTGADGAVTGCRRVRRYERGRADRA
ncbi:gas vesicle protein [Streptomyces sp. PT12]|nr:gas vesicle protein [Streptomyces sp. PT12]